MIDSYFSSDKFCHIHYFEIKWKCRQYFYKKYMEKEYYEREI